MEIQDLASSEHDDFSPLLSDELSRSSLPYVPIDISIEKPLLLMVEQ